MSAVPAIGKAPGTTGNATVGGDAVGFATFTTVESICVKSGPRDTTAATLQTRASTFR